MTQLLLDLKPDAPPSFGNYVAGRNVEAVRTLRTLADGREHQSVYLWGESGAGKSHLLAACATLPGRDRPATHCTGGTVPPPEQLDVGSLLLIDAIDALDADAQTTLFRLFNNARHQRWTLIVAARVPPLALPLREDLRTRLGQCLIMQLQPLSDDEKRAALQRHGQTRGMRLDESLLDYLMHHSRRDLPSLLRTLDLLDQISLERKRQPTLPLLRELLQSFPHPDLS